MPAASFSKGQLALCDGCVSRRNPCATQLPLAEAVPERQQGLQKHNSTFRTNSPRALACVLWAHLTPAFLWLSLNIVVSAAELVNSMLSACVCSAVHCCCQQTGSAVCRTSFVFDALNLPAVINENAVQTLLLNQDR